MPIRTNRGRAAVYRRLWGWPLRSPRHLVVTLVIVVVLAIGIAIATSHGNAKQAAGGGPAVPGSSTDYFPTDTPTGTGTGAGEGAGGSATGTAGATSAPPLIRLSGPPQTPSSAATSPEAIDVIKTWGQEWVHHPVGMTNAQWLAQLQPYTTQEFLPVMSTVNVANIDATEVTGPPQVKKSYASSVEAMLPTNSGQLDITAISTPQGWQVASYTEAS